MNSCLLAKNLLKPADGALVLAIYQDVVLGIYYLTYDKPGTDTEKVKAFFSSIYEAEMAYDHGDIALQTPPSSRKEIRNTTLGRDFQRNLARGLSIR